MVYVIVLNWNGAADTVACAESILALEGVAFQLVICDNASTDDSIQSLRAWGASKATLPSFCEMADDASAWRHAPVPAGSVVLLHTGANLGYAGGNNVGIRYALARGDLEYVWILNNDTIVTTDALKALVSKARSDARFGITGSTLLYHYRPEHVQVLGGCRFSAWTTRISPVGWGRTAVQAASLAESEIETQLDYVTGASMLVSRDFLADVGLMQDDYFLYFEEIDWAERGRRSANRRWKLGYARQSIVFHKVGASAGTGVSESATRYFYASKIRFMKRFYPARVPVTLLVILMQAVKTAASGAWGNAFVILKVLARAPFLKVAAASSGPSAQQGTSS